jgi:glycine hydroxymethyltransferase
VSAASGTPVMPVIADAGVEDLGRAGLASLARHDPLLAGLLLEEYERQQATLSLVASSCLAHPSVYAAQALGTDNLTTEGLPGARFHAGARVADQIEELAARRACRAFGAQAALVQPYSGSSANYLTMFSLCEPGDVVLSLGLRDGGHLSHGASAALPSKHYRVHHYGLTPHHRIDYGQLRALAHQYRPRLIIAGASSYPRLIDFPTFRDVADEVGAWLLADISHVSGLVAAGICPSPVDVAHVTTTSTYKQLGGPRGGLILLGKDHAAPVASSRLTLRRHLERAVFPFFQGTPSIGSIAAKARALDLVCQPAFRTLMRRVVDTAAELAAELSRRGYDIITGGTDTHMVLVRLSEHGRSGAAAQDLLEKCSIIVNKNLVPGDSATARTTSGLRLGTNSLAFRGMDVEQAVRAAALVDAVLASTPRSESAAVEIVRQEVAALCAEFPLDGAASWARP